MFRKTENKNRYKFKHNSKIEIKENIYSISFSNKYNKLYVCLLNKKVIRILEYDLRNKKLELCHAELGLYLLDEEDHFYNCIELTNDNILATHNDIK